jgi:hypothetical protein
MTHIKKYIAIIIVILNINNLVALPTQDQLIEILKNFNTKPYETQYRYKEKLENLENKLKLAGREKDSNLIHVNLSHMKRPLPTPEKVIQTIKKINTTNKSKYHAKTIMQLAKELKIAGREKESENIILELSHYKINIAIDPAILIYLKHGDLANAEELAKIQNKPQNSYILGLVHFQEWNKLATKEKALAHILTAAKKGHKPSILFLNEKFPNYKIAQTKKSEIFEKTEYQEIYQKYQIPELLELLVILKHEKSNKSIPKDDIISDFKRLSELHALNNLEPDTNITNLRKTLNLKVTPNKKIKNKTPINLEQYD